MRRLIGVLALLATSVVLVPATPASAAGDPTTAAASSATPAWLARINFYRAQFGAAPVTENAALSAADALHARYLAENGVVSQSEDPSLPGYSSSGATAGANSLVGAGYDNAVSYIDAWAASPFHMVSLLATDLTTVGMGMATGQSGPSAALNVVQGRTGTPAATGWPRAWPHAATSITAFSGGETPDPTLNCPSPTGWYGTPIIVDFGPDATVSSATASIKLNGSTLPVCVRVASDFSGSPAAQTLLKGKAFIVPLTPLGAGENVVGTVTTSSGTAPVDFYLKSAASGVFGDQNNDKRADLLTVNADGHLVYYQTRSTGIGFYSGVVTGSLGGTRWFTKIPDENADGVSDLLVMTDDGTLQMYRGDTMGRFDDRTQVGSGWSSMSALTVLPDLDGDGDPDLVARNSSGTLLLYHLHGMGKPLTGPTKIGTGWGSFSSLTSIGDVSGDGHPDLIGLTTAGNLLTYSFTSSGVLGSRRSLGSGFTGVVQLVSPGDLNGDGSWDLLMHHDDGSVWMFAHTGSRLGAGVRVTGNWVSTTLLG